MGKGILLCGCNGCGKSTLGRALGERLHIRFLDIEDYYFPKTDPGYPYRAARSREEVIPLLAADTAGDSPFVLAAVRGDFGPEVEGRFALAVLLTAPAEERARRVRQRSFRRFGERMLPGGDLYEAEEAFFRMAAAKSPAEAAAWTGTLSCPVVEVESSGPVTEVLDAVLEQLPKTFLER